MTRRRKTAVLRPFVEVLEGRWVPTTLTPTTFLDGGPGSGSLRDAVLQFNADTGTDDDIIQLQAGTYALTIQNIGGRHETAGLTGDLNLTQTSHRWIIQGAGPSTIIDASQLQDRVFQIVNPGTQVVFQDLVIQGGLAQDDGTEGALAGTRDALGGGVLNDGGDVTLDDVVVQNNEARGGDAASLGAPGHNASGGGIYSTGGALTLAGATIANNQATGGRGGDRGDLPPAGAGGDAASGGLYATGGSLDISDSMVASNRATGGRGGDGHISCTAIYGCFPVAGAAGGSAMAAGLYVNGGSLTIATSTIASNRATGGDSGLYDDGFVFPFSHGGGLYNSGTLAVSLVTLSDNSADRFSPFGGGIYNTGTLTVNNSSLSGNSAPYGSGGGIYNYGTLTVSNSSLSGNSANSGGGGIYNYSGTLTVSNSTLSGNSANSGGGISNYSGTLMVSNSALSGNSGGGISNGGTLTVSNSTLSDNSAYYGGGGIYNGGTLTLTGSTLSGNSAGIYGSGGGISNYNGTLMVSNSTLSGNSATSSYYDDGGGGIYNYSGTLMVSNSTLSGNSTGSHGGGIDNYGGTLTVSNSTVSGNTATGVLSLGGGIYNSNRLTVSNSTLSGNSAPYGGGIYNYSSGPITLTNVTLTANRANAAGQGGGGLSGGGSPVLHNTLIAGNFNGASGTTRDDVAGPVDPGGDYNLIGDGTGMTGLRNGVNGNQVGSASAPIDPRLSPLQDNGGPTLTHALLSSSPAIDAGNNAYATDWDQRGPGFRRIVNGTIDIGAFEVQAHAHGRPTGQPLPDPVPVQALGMPGGPLLGLPPDLVAAPSPLPGPGIPDGQTVQPAPVPTAGGLQAPATLFAADAGNRQPANALGPPDARDLDPLAQELLGGP
jgi:hypothetical protein